MTTITIRKKYAAAMIVASMLTFSFSPAQADQPTTTAKEIQALYDSGQKAAARTLLQDELLKIKKSATELESSSKSKQSEIDALRIANPNYGKSGVSAFIKEANISAALVSERLEASPTRFDSPSRKTRLQESKLLSQSATPADVIRSASLTLAELQRELQSASKNTRFTTPIYDHSGRKAEASAIRQGLFNITSDQGFLSSDGADLYLYERQPRRSIADNSLLDSLKETRVGQSILAIDPTAPAKGQIMKSYVERPTVAERYHQGGAVGYVISLLGLIMLIYSLYKVPRVVIAAIRVSSQKKHMSELSDGNALGRVISAISSAGSTDIGQLEIVAASSMEEEMSRITAGLHFIKTCSLVAPLLGLLGTVTGMIATFQTITAFGAVDPQMVSAGISEAMVCTVLGLIVAIPAMFFHALASSRASEVASTVEVAALNKIATLALAN